MRKTKTNCRVCKLCSKKFVVENAYGLSQQPKYCSAKCKTEGKRSSMLGKNTSPKPYMTGANNPNWGGKVNFKREIHKEMDCEYCGILFNYTVNVNRNRRFCSVSCKTLGDKGDKHKNWRGGITPERVLAMTKPEYKNWRKAVFERDNYTCQKCFRRGVALNADHIKPWALYVELRYDINNGRTLCVKCHRETETYGGRTKK